MKKFYNRILGFSSTVLCPLIWRGLKIIFWPVLAVVTVMEQIIRLLCTLGRAVAAVFEEAGACFKELFDNWTERRRKRKTWKKLIRLLNRIVVSNTPLLQNTMLGGITGILMFLLQTISFFTTYGGTRYYFSDIGVWAPVALAIVIQSTIMVFSFSLETKGQNQAARKRVLGAAVCVSILFSYVGMVNSAIPPYEDYARQYDGMYNDVEVLRKTLVNDPEVAYSPLDAANVIYEEIQYGRKCYQGAANILSSESITDEHIQELRELSRRVGYHTTTTENPDGSTSEVVVTVDLDNSAAIAELGKKMEARETVESIQAGMESLDAALAELGIDMDAGGEVGANHILEWEEVMKGYADGEGRKQFYGIYEKYDRVATANAALAGTLQELLSDGQGDSVPQAVSAADFLRKLEAYDMLQGLRIGTSGEILSAVRLGVPIETLIKDPQEASAAAEAEDGQAALWTVLSGLAGRVLKIQTSTIETYKSVMEGYVSQAQKVITLFKTLGVTEKLEKDAGWENIHACYEAFSNAPDASIIAFFRLFNRNTWQRVIVPALLAVLVDLGTIVIAWGGQRRRYSPLYANTNRDYFEEETDLLEQIFTSSLRAEGIQTPGGISDEEFVQKCEHAVISTINFVNGYLDQFEPFQETVELGCGLIAEAGKFKDPQYAGLTSLLLNMGYLCPLSQEQYYVLRYNQLDRRLSEETAYYCLKFRAESYLRQCTTSTSLYAHYIMDFLDAPAQNKQGGA